MMRLRCQTMPVGKTSTRPKNRKIAPVNGAENIPPTGTDNLEKWARFNLSKNSSECWVDKSTSKMVTKQHPGKEHIDKTSKSSRPKKAGIKATLKLLKKHSKISLHNRDGDSSTMDVDVKSSDERMDHELSNRSSSFSSSSWSSSTKPLNVTSTPCDDYSDEIYHYLQTMEIVTCQPINFLEGDGNPINSYSRAILMDWLVKVQCHLELLDQTLFLAMNLIDKFISVSKTTLDKLQLVGITCLLIASKLEERYPPEIAVLCYLTDHTYSKNMVLRMEIIVLRKIRFGLSLPTSTTFFDMLSCSEDTRVAHLGRYLMDLSLCTTGILSFPPSLRAAAALRLAQRIWDSECCDEGSSSLNEYTDEDMTQCIQMYARLLLKAPTAKQQAARTKYSSRSRYNAISFHPMLTESAVVYSYAHEDEYSTVI
ncbi:G2/mitotic-specific cyclin-B2-like [Saccoglossus kowalevskii]|uniref:G2/mitotic-specific cyclin-B2-like isoform X2 n=1 Tax=Saccoglossus kowalevskii TaxID=10224 RepID=A0ABM0MPB4_SACKO|nr:PREDICTED: G2/mitotic-specific cyclin-B2-like isoform X2 [Saccoglossus kowalevskii]